MMNAIIKNIPNNTKKSNFRLDEKVNVFKDENGFPFDYEICFCSLKGQSYLVIEKELGNEAYLVCDNFQYDFSFDSKKRDLFDYRIQNLISNSLSDTEGLL